MNHRTQMINLISSVNSSMITYEYFIKKAKLDSFIENMNYFKNAAPNWLNCFNNQLNLINQNKELSQDFLTEATTITK